MAQLKIVFWRDIPGQVVIRRGRRSTRLRLPPRFSRAIERAAYRLKKKQQDALFEPWHDVAQPFSLGMPTIKLCQRLRVFPIWHQTVAVGLIVAIHEFLNFWIDGMTDHLNGGLLEFAPLVSALLLWPLMSGFSNRALARG